VLTISVALIFHEPGQELPYSPDRVFYDLCDRDSPESKNQDVFPIGSATVRNYSFRANAEPQQRDLSIMGGPTTEMGNFSP
jgi:hypothetical protein